MTGKRPYSFPKTIGLLATLVVMAGTLDQTALANPEGGVVAAGSAVISAPDPKTLNIHQSTDKAIIDWRSFNIAVDETTQFFQPSSSSWTLNRVAGSQDPSQILGTLRANGNIVIVNPDGILFGPNSRVDVNGLVATTHDIRNGDFMAGRMDFSIPGKASASIVNQGNISIADQGIGAFVAPGVRNQGVIAARFGKVTLAAANGFTLDFYGDDLVRLVVGDEIAREVVDVATGKPMADLVKNEGRINADGGIVALSAATARRAVNSVVNNTGVIEARSIGQRNGRISLGGQTAKTKVQGAPVQKVLASGKLDVSGRNAGETGGKVQITGEEIQLADLAIAAEGHSGGGRVLAGGDYMGGNGDQQLVAQYAIPLETTPVPTAQDISLADNVSINADAVENGKGGKIILWADGTTQTAAALTARGGLLGGDGGFIETSGKQSVDIAGSVLAGASHGHNGLWLTDPTSVTVDAAYAATIATALNSGTDHQITTGAFGADNPATITVNSAILKTAGGEATLSITAADGVILNKRIASTSGMLNINVYGDSDRDGSGGLTINNTGAASGYAFETNGGDFKFWGQSLVFNHYNGVNTSSSTIGGDITLTHNDFDWAEFYADAASPALPANHYGLDTGGTGNVTITSRYRGTNDFVELYDNAIRGYNVTITATTLSLGRHIGNGIPEIVYYGSYPVISPGTDARLEMRNGNSSSSLAAVGASLQEVSAKNLALRQANVFSLAQPFSLGSGVRMAGSIPSIIPAQIDSNNMTIASVLGLEPGPMSEMGMALVMDYIGQVSGNRYIGGFVKGLPTYGNYGGPGWTANSTKKLTVAEIGKAYTTTPPVNELDEVFYRHDLAYAKAASEADKIIADYELIHGIANQINRQEYPYVEKKYMLSAMMLFAAKQTYSGDKAVMEEVVAAAKTVAAAAKSVNPRSQIVGPAAAIWGL